MRSIAALALLAACGSRAAPPPPPRTIAELVGHAPAPCGPLAGLDLGMTVAKAKARSPALFATLHDDRASIEVPTLPGVSAGANAHGRVEELWISFPIAARADLDRAWGPPETSRDSFGLVRTWWRGREWMAGALIDPTDTRFEVHIDRVASVRAIVDQLARDAPHLLGAGRTTLADHFADRLIEPRMPANPERFGVDPAAMDALPPMRFLRYPTPPHGFGPTLARLTLGPDQLVQHLELEILDPDGDDLHALAAAALPAARVVRNVTSDGWKIILSP